MKADTAPRRVLHEPLAHFLLLGALIFAVHAWLSGDEARDRRVVIDGAAVAHLNEAFEAMHGRPPDPDDLVALITQRVREEILAAEARSLGLDVDDPSVRTRLAEKMDQLAEASARLAPRDGEVEAWARANPESDDPLAGWRAAQIREAQDAAYRALAAEWEVVHDLPALDVDAP